MKKKEVFVEVKGFESMFLVSNLGRLQVLPKKYKVSEKARESIYPGYFKSRTLHPDGFLYYAVRMNKKVKMLVIDKLVASHFCENPNGYFYVKHIDGNKLNNHYSNLVFVKNRQELKKAPK